MKKEEKPATHVIVGGQGPHRVVVVSRADGVIEAYASHNQNHIGFFAENGEDDIPELRPLRPIRDALLEALRKLLTFEFPSN